MNLTFYFSSARFRCPPCASTWAGPTSTSRATIRRQPKQQSISQIPGNKEDLFSLAMVADEISSDTKRLVQLSVKGKQRAYQSELPDSEEYLSHPRVKLPSLVESKISSVTYNGNGRKRFSSSEVDPPGKARKRNSDSADSPDDTDFELGNNEDGDFSEDDNELATRTSGRIAKILLPSRRSRNSPPKRSIAASPKRKAAAVRLPVKNGHGAGYGKLRLPPHRPSPSEDEDESQDSEEDTLQSENSEDDLPYGGYLTGPNAAQDDRIPGPDDEALFQLAVDAAASALHGSLDYYPPLEANDLDVDGDTLFSLPESKSIDNFGANGYIHPAVRGLRDSLATPLFDSRLRGQESLGRERIESDGPAGTLVEEQVVESYSTRRPARSASVLSGLPDGAYSNIQAIRFGQEWEIKTWYQAPYPEDFAQVAEGRIWLCEFCLKYFASHFQESRHRVSSTGAKVHARTGC